MSISQTTPESPPDPGPPDVVQDTPDMVTLNPQQASQVRALLRGESVDANEMAHLVRALTPKDTIQDRIRYILEAHLEAAGDLDATVAVICAQIANDVADELRIDRSLGTAKIGLTALQLWLEPTRR